MTQAATTRWTTPYFGLQHTEKDTRGRRCSVQSNGPWAELQMWFLGCGFNPMVSAHDTPDEARAAGEKWLREGSGLHEVATS